MTSMELIEEHTITNLYGSAPCKGGKGETNPTRMTLSNDLATQTQHTCLLRATPEIRQPYPCRPGERWRPRKDLKKGDSYCSRGWGPSPPELHPGLTRLLERLSRLVRAQGGAAYPLDREGKVEGKPRKNLPPPQKIRVNRRACRFGQYKNPRRPYPPPCASRVSHHQPQVSTPHPRSPSLTTFIYPHPPPSAPPAKSCRAGPFCAPGQRGLNGLPRRCRSWVSPHTTVSRL